MIHGYKKEKNVPAIYTHSPPALRFIQVHLHFHYLNLASTVLHSYTALEGHLPLPLEVPSFNVGKLISIKDINDASI